LEDFKPESDGTARTMSASHSTDEHMIHELKKFDTATICNVVATYPDSDICLKLYDAWRGEYYTDASLRCLYPEYGPICGYAATAWYSDERAEQTKLNPWLLFDHLDRTPKPIILVAKQTYSEGLENRSGLFGMMMSTEFKALGVKGVVTDGPMRDYVDVKSTKIQYLATGLTSGHGPLQLRGAGIPVKIAGMSVSPGDIVHVDECGACKFPADRLSDVIQSATELLKREKKARSRFEDSNFSLKRWKAEMQGTRTEK
jgi:4-hydroxy-4-methyl-2-oxoglutarate aldolase